MDLSIKSTEHMQYMIEQIKVKLRMASGDVLRATHFDLEQYDNIKFIYDMVMSKSNISIPEMEAIATELRKMRS